jgi:hypothetical protein
MWQVFYLIKEAFYRDAADYFAGKKKVKIENFSFFFLFLLRNYELFA